MNIEGGAVSRLNTTAEIVSYAGVTPFVLCLLGIALLPDYEAREIAQRIDIAYGSALLSFVGAVHWGLALAGRMSWRVARVCGAIVPALLGAAATVLGGQRGLALLVVGFGAFWLYEHKVVGNELPAAYLRLRRILSQAVCALLAVTLILSDKAGLV